MACYWLRVENILLDLALVRSSELAAWLRVRWLAGRCKERRIGYLRPENGCLHVVRGYEMAGYWLS
jgi:hypothetical protein